ncbi:MAG: leucyl aminopeptidase [Polyangiaceae bacterium]|nr:leucyl aminopeptidase [Polyangiaceae bacterium]MCE7890813.1 leucyl aminopeptidase [Sorangiineae bacterium PRO1]MCL4753429.1 leucyl aminopeptidase [Myxococcales bacterium]
MDLRFVTRDLRRLDLAATEVLLGTLTEDERPPHGVAGLVDWRLAGRVSELLRSGYATGALGEVLLVPGKPKLPFDKLVFFGCGPRSAFGEKTFRRVIENMLATLEGLCVRSAVVELPGRHFDAILPERAADILLEQAASRPEHDVWTLVETAEAQRSITQHMVAERRRVRQP